MKIVRQRTTAARLEDQGKVKNNFDVAKALNEVDSFKELDLFYKAFVVDKRQAHCR
jgi:ribosomal 50S subunit-recycling heat shock protein